MNQYYVLAHTNNFMLDVKNIYRSPCSTPRTLQQWYFGGGALNYYIIDGCYVKGVNTHGADGEH